MTKELAARRLSAALGRKVTADDIASIDRHYVTLKNSDKTFALYAGNACYAGDGVYMKNGEVWDQAYEDEANMPRWLTDVMDPLYTDE